MLCLRMVMRWKAPGEIGALMRREGIYSSLLSTWRTQRTTAQRLALEPQKRGPKVNPMLAHTQGMAKLRERAAVMFFIGK